MSYQFVSYLRELDLSVFHAVNGFCGQNPKLDQFIIRTDFSSLKGLFFVSTFGALWFQRADDQARRRQTLIIMVIAIFVSIIAARAAAILLPFRIRPMFVSDIGFHAPLFSVGNYEDWSSFPSDTATYYFVITTGFWFLSRWWGFFWVCFSIIAILARVYLGIHYPSDVLAGALLGICITVVMNNEFVHARIAAPVLAAEHRSPAIFYGLLFPVLFETATIFHFTRVMRHWLFGH
jgi:undecaprenyl-diphosphatase